MPSFWARSEGLTLACPAGPAPDFHIWLRSVTFCWVCATSKRVLNKHYAHAQHAQKAYCGRKRYYGDPLRHARSDAVAAMMLLPAVCRTDHDQIAPCAAVRDHPQLGTGSLQNDKLRFATYRAALCCHDIIIFLDFLLVPCTVLFTPLCLIAEGEPLLHRFFHRLGSSRINSTALNLTEEERGLRCISYLHRLGCPMRKGHKKRPRAIRACRNISMEPLCIKLFAGFILEW